MTETWPDYCCVILRVGQKKLLLERRPKGISKAPGQLTCFGGRREEGETPRQCLDRELMEELAWTPKIVERTVDLWVDGRLIAWFYEGELDREVDALVTEPDREAIVVSTEEIAELPLSPWHTAVLGAWLRGDAKVELD